MAEEKKNPEHKRRAHYSGKYPRRFEEKYKELDPEKYGEIAEHVMKKGSTPAGTHISIMVDEILDFLDIQPGQNGLDATLGYGGHTRRMLEKLQGQGHIVGLDVDPIESAKTEKRLREAGYDEDSLSVMLTNFRNLDKAAEKYGKFDFILADLGVSSMQIDNPERGFSYKFDGPLDLRLDPTHGVPASERLAELTQEEIEGMLVENADEPYADKIAGQVISARRKGIKIETTLQFRDIIEKALWQIPEKERKDAVKKSCARCFQALRIDVNEEFEVLYEFLEKLPTVLKPGGKAAILTFHSGEARLVKQSFKHLYQQGIYESYSKDMIRPSAEECARNPRAKSTKMSWVIRSRSE